MHESLPRRAGRHGRVLLNAGDTPCCADVRVYVCVCVCVCVNGRVETVLESEQKKMRSQHVLGQ